MRELARMELLEIILDLEINQELRNKMIELLSPNDRAEAEELEDLRCDSLRPKTW